MQRSLVLALCLATGGFASAGASTQFRGSAAHLGTFAGPAPDALTLRWRFDPAGDRPELVEPIFSSPVVVDGTVYVGASDNCLHAVDAQTGKERWRFKTTGGPGRIGGNVASTPAVADGVVYFVAFDGNAYAVDAATGKERWTFATGGERRFSAPGMDYVQPMAQSTPDPWDLFLSSPAVVDGTVYFGSGDGRVYALDAATGKARWSFKTGDVVHASPAVAEGVVYVGSFDRFFYALDARTGELRWKFETGADPQFHNQEGLPGSAAVADGMVYFGCRDANLYALDAATGELRWKYWNDHSWVIASPAVASGTVYFTTSDTHKFIALDARTGKERFTLPGNLYFFSSPAISGERAYFGGFDGRLRVVDLAAQRYLGTFTVPGTEAARARWLTAKEEFAADVWRGETIEDVVLALYGRVFALGSILSSPCVADGVVYFTSTDGRLYAVGGK